MRRKRTDDFGAAGSGVASNPGGVRVCPRLGRGDDRAMGGGCVVRKGARTVRLIHWKAAEVRRAVHWRMR